MISSRAAAASRRPHGSRESAWPMLLAAGAMAAALEHDDEVRLFEEDAARGLRPLAGPAAAAALAWHPQRGWVSRLPSDDPRLDLLGLYLPICSATPSRPITVGHLGQSLDGFIATPSGDSQFVTGDENLVHVHRMRALCDAIVVGAGTVAADDPQLTTRHVAGPNPLRVIFDPGRRLTPAFRVFADASVPTVYVCTRAHVAADEAKMGAAAIEPIEASSPAEEAAQLVDLLRRRGCARVFVEGGGVTVSTFLEADLLDRLQIAIAPVLIGEGRPAIRLAPHTHLRDCRRPRYRVFRMGGDVLFDCDLRTPAGDDDDAASGQVSRII